MNVMETCSANDKCCFKWRKALSLLVDSCCSSAGLPFQTFESRSNCRWGGFFLMIFEFIFNRTTHGLVTLTVHSSLKLSLVASWLQLFLNRAVSCSHSIPPRQKRHIPCYDSGYFFLLSPMIDIFSQGEDVYPCNRHLLPEGKVSI